VRFTYGLRWPGIDGYVVDAALALTRASLEVLYDFFGTKILRTSFSSQLSAFRQMLRWPLGDFVRNAKFWTAAPMALFLRNELPKLPSTTYHSKWLGHGDLTAGQVLLFSGPVRKLLKNRLTTPSMKNARLFQGFLQGVKRGAIPVPESFVNEALDKHKSALTREREVDLLKQDALEILFDRFFAAMPIAKPKLHDASTAAAFPVLRSEGGAREYLRLRKEVGGDPTGRRRGMLRPVFVPADADLLQMYEERPGVVVEVRGRSGWTDIDELKLEANRLDNPFTGDPVQRDAVSHSLLGAPFSKLPMPVEVHPVLEPLKVRLITKGEPLRY